jgi:hypothetical protein
MGLTLLELLISITVSMSMALVLIELHLQSSLALDTQQASSRRLESAAAMQHILSHAVRDALFSVHVPDQADTRSAGQVQAMPGYDCDGVVINQQCIAPVMAWTAASGSLPMTDAVVGSSVLQVKQSCCVDVIADQFFLAHRGGLQSNPVSLYRRRLQPSGGFTSAVELVEGVTELNVSFVIEDATQADLALVSADQVSDWWRLRAVRIEYRLQHQGYDSNQDEDISSFSFTLASRQWQQVSGFD